MQDSKEMSWASDRDADKKLANSDHKDDADGWQQYRKWISKAPAPRKKRMGVDPSLYTWKGYRTWTEQVKRNWSDNS